MIDAADFLDHIEEFLAGSGDVTPQLQASLISSVLAVSMNSFTCFYLLY